MIVKNCDDDRNYKITLYKFNQALVKHNDIKYWVEKYILQNINDIDNIDKFKLKSNRNDLDLINIGNSEIPNLNAEDNLDEFNILSMHEDYDSSIMTIQNPRLIVKISECDFFSYIFVSYNFHIILHFNFIDSIIFSYISGKISISKVFLLKFSHS